jgi:sulfur carrier protein ThiS
MVVRTHTNQSQATPVATMQGVSESAITVEVRLGARVGPGRRSVQLRAGATVADLLAVLEAQLGRELAGVAVAVAGEIVGRGHVLRDGDAPALVLPVAGG